MLKDLIQNLSKEEARYVKLFLNRTNASKERKDIRLFDMLRKSTRPDEDKISGQLYEGKGKNAYYRLKNRLLEDINKSLVTQYYDSNEPNLCFQYVILSRHFFHRNKFDLAYKYLKRAEKIADTANLYEVLDIIYTDYIRLSHETLGVNPEVFIEKRKVIRDNIKKVREIDDVLAMLIFRIKKSQNYAKRNEKILLILQETINDFTQDNSLKKSPVLRFKVYDALSRILLQQQDYKSLEKYLEDTYTTFQREKLFKKSNHDTKLQMLTYWCNALFKNHQYERSLEIADQLQSAIDEYGGALRDKYLFFFVNAQIINYSILDQQKALEIADAALGEKTITKNAFQRVFLLLNKAQLLFDLESYRQANRSLVQLKLDDAYDRLDEAFRLKIRVAEVIFRYEMEDYDTVEMLIRNVERDFKEIIDESDYERQRLVLEIITAMMTSHNIKQDKTIGEMIERVVNMLGDDEADETDLINYNTWLRPKISS